MKTTEETWLEKMGNLNARRKTDTNFPANHTNPFYGEMIKKCFIGNSVLDVGCGGMAIKNFLSPGVKYTGIDPFPLFNEVQQMKIEDCTFPDYHFDTVYCFAVLDGVQDAAKALQQMKRVCACNIVILTGIDIEADQFHTFKITEAFLLETIGGDFRMTYKEEIRPKVFLYEFSR